MNKPGSLRKAIGDALPQLRKNPDRLLVFTDAGHIVARNTASQSFEYRYDLNLILTDFKGDPAEVFLALLAWVKVNQPDLLDHPDKRINAIAFEADHLNNEACDLSIKLPLTEEVRVTVDTDGKRSITYPPEPIPEWTKIGTLYDD